jgi:WD40 repeat protein
MLLMLASGNEHPADARILATITPTPDACNGAGESQFFTVSPDGKYVMVYWRLDGLTGTVRVWDVRTGQPLQSFAVPYTTMNAAFSPDSKFIIVVADEAVLWDISTGARIRSFPPPVNTQTWSSPEPIDIIFTPDGKYVIITAWDGAYMWDMHTGKHLRTFPHTIYISYPELSPDGKYLITEVLEPQQDWEVVIWEILTGRKLHSFRKVWWGIFSRDGRYILGENYDDELVLWSARTYAKVLTFAETKDKSFLGGQFSTDGRYLLANPEHTVEDPNSGERDTVRIVQLWDVRTGNRIPIFDAANPHPTRARLMPDGKHIIMMDESGVVFRIWDIATHQEIHHFSVGVPTDESTMIDIYRVSPDGKSLLAMTKGGYLESWDIQSGKKIRRFC